MEKILTHAAGRLVAGLALAAASASFAQAAIYVDYSQDLTGTVWSAGWESGRLAGTGIGGSENPSNQVGFSGTGDVTLNPVAPGYRASIGFYSFMGDFGARANAVTDFAVQTVVFQLVMMQNPDFTLADSLSYNGGPVLNYYTGVGEDRVLAGSLSADYRTVTNGPVAGSGGGFEGDFYALGWQWDLSAVSDVITDFEVVAPIIVHSATTEARLDVSDSFTQVIPEPAHYAVAFGVVLCGIAVARRRKQRAA